MALLQQNLRRDDHELLESETATGVGATVEDVHEGNGENVGLLGASKVGDVGVERDTLLGSSGLSDSHGDTEDGVGTELGLVGGTIKLVHEVVNGALVLDVEVLLDEGGAKDVVDVGDGLEDTLATPLGLVTIAELAGLVGAGRSTGGDDGTVKTGLGDYIGSKVSQEASNSWYSLTIRTDVHLNGGVTARVVDLAGVDLLDRHDAGGSVSQRSGTIWRGIYEDLPRADNAAAARERCPMLNGEVEQGPRL